MKIKALISLILVGLILFPITVSGATYRKELEAFPSEVGNVSRYENVADSPLYQKSAIFFGDSLCNAKIDADSGTKTPGYAGRIGAKYSMDWNKAGQGGWSYAKTNSDNQIIYTQVTSNKNKKYDYVIFQGTVNDAGRDAPLGKLSEGYELSGFSEKIPSTTAIGLERAFYEAKKAYPDAIFGFIMMYSMPQTPSRDDQGVYYDLVKEACEKWDVQFLNMYEDEDFCENVMKVRSKKYLYDGCHMTSEGYDIISPYIAAWMETLTADAKLVQKFKDEVAAISDSDSTEAKYTKIQAALKTYSTLNVHEKKEVEGEYSTLQSAVSAYNTNATNANTALSEASKVAFVPLTVGAGLGLLSSFLALVKKLLGI